MKPSLIQLVAAVILARAAAQADVVVSSGLLETPIPDDRNTGLALALDVAESFAITGVTVTLDLGVPAGSSGWFGDLYAYVQHDTGMSVLLNRPGRATGNIGGYGDSQNALVTFADNAANGDIHTYRLALFGDETVSLDAPLGGSWQPDGRASDPATALTGLPRNALLQSLSGLDAAGTWTLFIADLSSGGQFQVNQWSVGIVGAVPEPAHLGLAAGALLAGWIGVRRRLRGRDPAGRGGRTRI